MIAWYIGYINGGIIKDFISKSLYYTSIPHIDIAVSFALRRLYALKS